jgi:hypothetical protein
VTQHTGAAEAQTAFVGWTLLGLGIGIWLFVAYALFRIGRKFRVGSFGAYCVPVYNLLLICRCAGLPGWVALGSYAAALRWLAPTMTPLLFAVTAGFSIYLWGTVAQRLGKDFWVWGVASGILGLPIVALAFDSSTPRQASDEQQGGNAEVYDAVYLNEQGLPVVEDPQGVRPLGIRLVMRCTAGEHAGEAFELPSDGIVIGRDPAVSQLVLDSPEVSSRHVQIGIDPSDKRMVVVRDLDSTNGTYVMHLVTGPSRWEVVHGSFRYPRSEPRRIRIGDGIAEFEVRS